MTILDGSVTFHMVPKEVLKKLNCIFCFLFDFQNPSLLNVTSTESASSFRAQMKADSVKSGRAEVQQRTHNTKRHFYAHIQLHTAITSTNEGLFTSLFRSL